MRAAVALVTMVATVLHLAVGCCGHALHFDGAVVCCGGNVVSGAAIECCTDHDHDCDHGCESEPASRDLDARGSTTGMHGVIAPGTAGSDCCGCTCVAKIETHRGDDVAPLASEFLASLESAAIVSEQAARGPCEAWDPPVPSELRPPLFERLVV